MTPSIFDAVDTGAAFCTLFDKSAAGIWDQAFYYGMTMGILIGICMMYSIKGI